VMQCAAAAKRYQEAAKYKHLLSSLESRMAQTQLQFVGAPGANYHTSPNSGASYHASASARGREDGGAECWGVRLSSNSPELRSVGNTRSNTLY
jgi:hypothetical protein